MLRPFLYEIVLFALPFLVYALYRWIRSLRGFAQAGWETAPLLPLLTIAVVCVGMGLALFAHFGSVPAGSPYIPAHMENGRLVEPETR